MTRQLLLWWRATSASTTYSKLSSKNWRNWSEVKLDKQRQPILHNTHNSYTTGSLANLIKPSKLIPPITCICTWSVAASAKLKSPPNREQVWETPQFAGWIQLEITFQDWIPLLKWHPIIIIIHCIALCMQYFKQYFTWHVFINFHKLFRDIYYNLKQ